MCISFRIKNYSNLLYLNNVMCILPRYIIMYYLCYMLRDVVFEFMPHNIGLIHRYL